MELRDIRIKNLLLLIDETGLTRLEFARCIGYDDTNYLNQVIRKHKHFGTKFATKIEENFGKPIGWLSIDRDSQQARDEMSSKLLNMVENLSPEQLKALEFVAGDKAALRVAVTLYEASIESEE